MEENQENLQQTEEQQAPLPKEVHVSPEKAAAATNDYKCPSCGASMRFDPTKQCLSCDYCGTTQAIVFDTHIKERSFEELFSTDPWVGDVKTVRCENCGARQVLDNHEIATVCPFCGSAAVLETNEVDGIKPDTAVPFKISKETAAQKCLKWLKSKILAPTKFKKEARLASLNGCYVPVWTFDCDTVAEYYGRMGEHYTETYYSNGKQYSVTKTRYFYVSGTIDNYFDDIFIQGTTAVDPKFLRKTGPFSPQDYVKYDDKMLAGFSANHYDVDPNFAWEMAEKQVRSYFENEIIARYNADEVVFLNISLTHRNRSFKYLMVPLYISAVKYNDKIYNQYINGHNGSICGSAPLSPVKTGLTVLGCAALVVGVILLFTLL